MMEFSLPFSQSQLMFLAIVPKITSIPSIIGSTFIIQHVIRSKKRRSQVYHRLLLSMSIADCIWSIKTFLSTWVIPADVPFVYANIGNTQTCTASAFIGHGAPLSSTIYNGMLTLYFLLTIRYGWSNKKVKSKVEVWMHAIPLVIGWGTAIVALSLDLFNPIGWTCWIGTYPVGCGTTTFPCSRGNSESTHLYRWVFFHAELLAMFGFTAVSLFIIYRFILVRERAIDRYRISEQEKKNRVLSRQFAVQASAYVAAFFISWIFPMVRIIVAELTDQIYTPLIFLIVVFAPLQGFFNALIYLRPRYLKYRREQRRRTIAADNRWQAMAQAISVYNDDLDDDVITEGDTDGELYGVGGGTDRIGSGTDGVSQQS
jgi:hypothetical protein